MNSDKVCQECRLYNRVWRTVTTALCVVALWASVNPAHSKNVSYDQRVRCLAEVVYREARGEPHRGQLAVAQTVINRVKHSQFPNDICRVVFQRGQFSWTQNWDRAWRADHHSTQVARVAMMGTHSMRDFQALYFHNKSVKPSWKRKHIATIGNHVFYK